MFATTEGQQTAKSIPVEQLAQWRVRVTTALHPSGKGRQRDASFKVSFVEAPPCVNDARGDCAPPDLMALLLQQAV